MKIVHYHACRDREYWLEKIRACDWSAGQYLYQLLKDGRFHEVLGEESELLLCRYILGRTQSEMALIWHIPQYQVSRKEQRARQHFRTAWDE